LSKISGTRLPIGEREEVSKSDSSAKVSADTALLEALVLVHDKEFLAKPAKLEEMV